MSKLNIKLQQARKRAHLTQRELAIQAHVDERSYQRYELGEAEPKVGTAIAISHIVHEPVERLFGYQAISKDTTNAHTTHTGGAE